MSSLSFNARGPLGAIARRYAWSVPIVAVLSIVGSALEGAGIGLLIPLLTALLSADGGGGLALIDRWVGDRDPATRLVLVAGTIFVLIVLLFRHGVWGTGRQLVARVLRSRKRSG